MTAIEPGSKVKITVKTTLLKPAAAKTVARLFLKDEAKSHNRKAKPVAWRQRAGRQWHHQKRGSVAMTPNVGDSATLIATVDVIRDLNSVDRFIEIS